MLHAVPCWGDTGDMCVPCVPVGHTGVVAFLLGATLGVLQVLQFCTHKGKGFVCGGV